MVGFVELIGVLYKIVILGYFEMFLILNFDVVWLLRVIVICLKLNVVYIEFFLGLEVEEVKFLLL